MAYADPHQQQQQEQQQAPRPVDFAWARGRLFDEAACFALYSMVVEAGQGVVRDVRAE